MNLHLFLGGRYKKRKDNNIVDQKVTISIVLMIIIVIIKTIYIFSLYIIDYNIVAKLRKPPTASIN